MRRWRHESRLAAAETRIGRRSDRLILVVDDSAEVRHSIATVLTQAGYFVRTFANGRDAADMVQAVWPALVITDVFMPECDGFELIRQMAAARPDVPVLAMSGGSFMGAALSLEISELLGAQEVLVKPFGREALLVATQRCLGA